MEQFSDEGSFSKLCVLMGLLVGRTLGLSMVSGVLLKRNGFGFGA